MRIRKGALRTSHKIVFQIKFLEQAPMIIDIASRRMFCLARGALDKDFSRICH
jgi:hypothetical protein